MATKAKKMKMRGGARPGAGRPPGKVSDTNLNIKIPSEELEAAKHAADKIFGGNLTALVREGIRRML